jgi:hypothetical protein
MDVVSVTRLLAIAGALIGGLGLLARANEIMRRPSKPDLTRPLGSVRRGVVYAFTLGMAPWEKESTRLHWVAYLRGIGFHLGIFAALGLLLASPWLARLPQPLVWGAAGVAAVGGVSGLLGLPLRWREANLRALSLPDDYAAVALTSVFVLLAAATARWPAILPVFYAVAALLLAYVPFGKIRHCLYFFYSKFFFGAFFGRRGVIGQGQSRYAE